MEIIAKIGGLVLKNDNYDHNQWLISLKQETTNKKTIS